MEGQELKQVQKNKLTDLILNQNDSYKQLIKRFIDWLGYQPLNAQTINEFIRFLKGKGLKLESLNIYIAGIKKRIRVAYKSTDFTILQQYWMELELAKVKSYKLSRNKKVIGREKYLTENEVQDLINNSTKRTSLIIQFLYETGLRVSEALNIKLTDIKSSMGIKHINILGKGRKIRTVKVSFELMKKIITTFKGSDYLFESQNHKQLNRVNVSKDIKRAGRMFLEKSISAHTLRHSFATNTIARTGKIKGVSEYLGHSTTAITQDMYNHEVLTEDDLKIESIP